MALTINEKIIIRWYIRENLCDDERQDEISASDDLARELIAAYKADNIPAFEQRLESLNAAVLEVQNKLLVLNADTVEIPV